MNTLLATLRFLGIAAAAVVGGLTLAGLIYLTSQAWDRR